MLFIALVMLFGILAAMAGVAFAGHEPAGFELDGNDGNGSGITCDGKAITGSNGPPFPTGCR
jgi:hypothetical protein